MKVPLESPRPARNTYIHGSSAVERERLALMNSLINRRCLDLLRLDGESLVLDVGSGTGIFAALMAATLPPEARVIGVERDADQLAAAQARPPATEGATLEFRQGEATALPLRGEEQGRVDLAHTRFLLEHVPEPQAVVNAMVAAVRPGGRIALLDDDHALLRTHPEPPGLHAAWRAYWRTYRTLGTDPLVGRKLVRLLHRAGAEPLRIDQAFYGACAGEAAFTGIVDNLVGVLSGARAQVLAGGEVTAGDYDAAVAGLSDLKQRPDGALWYVINFAEGRRPA